MATTPLLLAQQFAAAGADLIHIVDLDGAIAGAPRNLEAVRAIRAAVGCRLDVSGGVRTLDSLSAVIEAGADVVSIGSAAFLNPALLVDACARYPGRIFGSLDVRDGKLAIRGWVETSELSVADAVDRFREAGVAAIIVTDISRDGTESGANLSMFAEAARLARVPIIASGGVASSTTCAASSRCFAMASSARSPAAPSMRAVSRWPKRCWKHTDIADDFAESVHSPDFRQLVKRLTP